MVGRTWPAGAPEQVQGRLLVSLLRTEASDPPTNEEVVEIFKTKAREVHLAADFVGAVENLEEAITAKPSTDQVSIQDQILQYGFPFKTKSEAAYVH